MEVQGTPAAGQTSFGDTISAGFGKVKGAIQSLFAQLDLSVAKLIELVSYFGVGFFLGFIVKKYGGYLFISLIVLALTLAVLHATDIAPINWVQIEQLVGVSPDASLGSLGAQLTMWFKTHWVSVASGLLGFLLGYKVG